MPGATFWLTCGESTFAAKLTVLCPHLSVEIPEYIACMAAWTQVESDAPGFASRVRERFSSGTNKTMATVRRDGSPRISGTELVFREGRINLGMMPGSVKLQDVRREPPGASCFEVDLTEVVLTYVDDSNTRLVIESWHDGRGWSTQSRV